MSEDEYSGRDGVVKMSHQNAVKAVHSINTSFVQKMPDRSGGLRSSPVSPQTDQQSPHSPLDPISRQILERTHSYNKHSAAPHASLPNADAPLSRPTTDTSSLRRVDTSASSKVGKDKKKGVSFLSRIMGGKKRDEQTEPRDSISEISDNRSSGNEVEVFSVPVGFIPRFPPPPKYIKVKAQNRRQRDFDRLFLAQVLLEEQKKSRNRGLSIDSKIHGIDDTPQEFQAPGSSGTTKAIWAAEFSRDGKYLAAAGQDKKLRVWEVISTPEDRESDGRQAAEGDSEGSNVRLNAPVFKQKLIREYDGHTSSILDLSWSKNNFLLSSSMDKTVRLYHVSREECLCAFKHNDFVTSIQFHPRDDRFFLAGSLDSRIRLWSIPDKSVAYMQQAPDMVTAVAFTPDGRTSIAGCLNGICILFDTEGLKAHSQIHVKSARGKNSKGSKVTGIETIALPQANGPPDIKLLITSNDSRIRMYNLKDRTLEIKFRGHENSCSQIRASFSDDGKYVICGSEDRKVYIWPTGPTERQDSDKRPVEVFEAHSSIVTSAILVSTKTRRALAQSGDPLYDLCNPPPVTLVSRAESIVSSRAPTNRTGGSEERDRTSSSPKRAPESPAYLARHSHPGGHILVTADYTGQIKVFRQDCAHQKRRQESWDTNSTFSRKILGRSNSGARRGSIGSSAHRASLNLGNKNQSADRILSWRNSISINGSTTAVPVPNSNSDPNLRASLSEDRPRESSPGKWAHRLSLRSSPRRSSLGNQKNNNNHHPQASSPLLSSGNNKAHIQVQLAPPETPDSPRRPSSGSFHSARSPSDQPRRPSNNSRDNSNNSLEPLPSNATNNAVPHDPNNALFLMDGVSGQSFLAWDMEHSVLPMVRRLPRTPGMLSANGEPLAESRDYLGAGQRRGSGASGGAGSVVSRLSSEVVSDEEQGGGGSSPSENKHGWLGRIQHHQDDNQNKRQGSLADEGGGDLTCSTCGGTTFKATLGSTGHRLRCKRCGTVM